MFHPPFNPALSGDESAPESRSQNLAFLNIANTKASTLQSDEFLGSISEVSETQVLELLSEFTRLEELLLNSPRVPLMGKTMVGEDELLEQMDFIRSHLPLALHTAQEVLQQRDRILQEAEQQAQQQIVTARQQAFQIANQLGIIDRAKAEAAQIRQTVQAECEQMRQQTLYELEQHRVQYLQETELIRQRAIQECQEIQNGADAYADQVLKNIEQQLHELQAQVQRGRQQLNPELGNSPS